MYYFIEISCVVTEVWMIYILLSRMFVRKEGNSWVHTSLCIMFGLILTVLSLLKGITFFRIGFSFLAIWAIGVISFQTNLAHSFFSSLIICVLVALADVTTSLLLQYAGLNVLELMSNPSSRSIYLVADHIVLLGMVVCVYFVAPTSGESLPAWTLTPILPSWGVSALLCMVLAKQILIEKEDVSPVFWLVLMGMLYTNIIVIYYVNKANIQAKEKRELEIAEHHYAMQQEYYDQFRIQQEETRALWHDVSKILHAVKADGSSETISQVDQMLDSVSHVVDVDNRVVSVILNEYAQIARNSDIVISMDIQVPQELFVTAVDLYILLGNTLENAIEACESLQPAEREIHVKLKTHNNILFYEIKNRFALSHFQRVRGETHGYGLQNVKRCVEKYNGSLDVQKTEGFFVVTAHLNSN